RAAARARPRERRTRHPGRALLAGPEAARSRAQGHTQRCDRASLRRRASPLAIAAREERRRAGHRGAAGAGELRAVGGTRSRVSGSLPTARPAVLPAEGSRPGPGGLREIPRAQTRCGRCQTGEGVSRGAGAVASTGRPRRRPPFTLALVGLVVLLTGLTGAVIGGLAWLEQRGRSRALLDAAMLQAARLTAANADRALEDAESTVRLGPLLVQQGQLDPDDAGALERFTLAVLRAHQHVSWVSYGSSSDHFLGAKRDDRGNVFVNHSFPVGSRIRLEEDRIFPDGRREAVRRVDDHGYRPTRRPY